MRKILLLAALASALCVFAQTVKEDSMKAKELNEIVVEGSYLTREDDHIVAVPTKQQRKHAVTGYDLLNNLMIPGISVNRKDGSITSPAGLSTIYIDGREVDFREIQSLRPKDIARVEYYDIPSGKFSKDASAINFVLKKQNNGGYTQLDALQGVGYLNGDYNLISKYVIGTKSINLWAGYSLEDPSSSYSKKEIFDSEHDNLLRENYQDRNYNRTSEEYLQASISNRGNKYIWMLRGGLSWNDKHNIAGNGTVAYILADALQNQTNVNLDIRNKTLRPSIYFYGLHTISDTKSFDYALDGYYARNDYNRLYNEGYNEYSSIVRENYYYTKLDANYSASFGHNNRLAVILYEFLRMSESNYFGADTYSQNLRSSETILFADYSQRLGKFFYDITPGLSFLTYRLKGMKSINHLTPRLQTRMAYMINRKQQLQFAFALGNTYPRINTINNVEQQIDPIIILKGNPGMDNSILLSPRFSYNLNLNRFAMQAGISYSYQNHSIVTNYFFRNENLICTFRDDCIYHKPGADISFTYKPSNLLNMKLSGLWSEHIVRGGVEHRNISSFSANAQVNYYIGDFSFGIWFSTPTKDLIDSQIHRKTYWQYQLSAMWNHENWAIEANVNNLFLMKNHIEDELASTTYSYRETNWNRSFNQYATLKIVYSFDYGKKTAKSPEYDHSISESAILH